MRRKNNGMRDFSEKGARMKEYVDYISGISTPKTNISLQSFFTLKTK